MSKPEGKKAKRKTIEELGYKPPYTQIYVCPKCANIDNDVTPSGFRRCRACKYIGPNATFRPELSQE